MRSTAPGSPRTRNVPDLAARIAKLKSFETAAHLEALDLSSLVGPDLWEQYWQRLERITAAMYEAQELATDINARVRKALSARSR
jgi:hypothetical protein